jgi:catechol 2,3-dioxygenase-like lactoylglutathione lyase family enzyme
MSMLSEAKAFSGFSVDDTAKARAFYADTLGLDMTVLDENMGLLQLNLPGDTRVLAYAKGEAHVPASFTILNFPVADVEAAVRELTDKGVEFLRYDGFEQDDLGIAHGPGPTIAWFTDPAGNILSVLSEQ